MKKYLSLTFVLLLTTNLLAQRDTIIFFTKQDATTKSINEASRYEKLTKQSNKKYLLTQYIKTADKWSESQTSTIIKLSDTKFEIRANDKITRQVNPLDSGYMVEDYINSRLVYKGFSYLIFPLVKSGKWVYYDNNSNSIPEERNYLNNRDIKSFSDSNDDAPTVCSDVDVQPSYEGGERNLMEQIYTRIVYPYDAKERGIQGRVNVRLIVLQDGTITSAEAINKIPAILAKEAIRVINSIPKKWIPAMKDNKKVNSYMYIPVTFQLK